MMNESMISIDHSRMKQIFPMQTFDPNFVAIQINHLESTNIPRASGSVASALILYMCIIGNLTCHRRNKTDTRFHRVSQLLSNRFSTLSTISGARCTTSFRTTFPRCSTFAIGSDGFECITSCSNPLSLFVYFEKEALP